MAKKNLSSLMSGLMGQPTPQEETDNIQAYTFNPADKEPSQQTVGKRKPGRPRNTSQELRATFIVNPELIRKVKYITLVEGNLQKDIIDAALRQYIRRWESANGQINLPDKR